MDRPQQAIEVKKTSATKAGADSMLSKRDLQDLLLRKITSIDASFAAEKRGLTIELFERTHQQVKLIFDRELAQSTSKAEKFYLVRIKISSQLLESDGFVEAEGITKERSRNLIENFRVFNYHTQ